jgi:hypothetical protein
MQSGCTQVNYCENTVVALPRAYPLFSDPAYEREHNFLAGFPEVQSIVIVIFESKHTLSKNSSRC